MPGLLAVKRWLLCCLLAVAVPADALAADQAWVELAPANGSVVRVLTSANACPAVTVDGRALTMAERAAPAVLPARSNKANVTTPVAFAARVCELYLPRAIKQASFAGNPLPLRKARINRIVLIGDTGCRLKDADKAWQGCNDPAQWPFAAIAARAAAMQPDLVLHVGDYHYRENACPPGQADCAGSVWGYGEDGWRADFLAPAAPLLAAAPWVMVRGNHEECARAGQGWWRLLAVSALRAGVDCLDPANDAAGDHTPPYPVDLGGGAQLVVAELMQLASGKASDPAVATLVNDDMAQIAALSRNAKDTLLTAHFPFNAVLTDKHGGDAVTIGGSKPMKADMIPPLPHVRAMLAGHIHTFQFARFSDRPTQVITGFSGTQEDAAMAPASLADAAGKPGAAPLTVLTTIPNRFGFGLLERVGSGWRLTAFAADGTTMGVFTL